MLTIIFVALCLCLASAIDANSRIHLLGKPMTTGTRTPSVISKNLLQRDLTVRDIASIRGGSTIEEGKTWDMNITPAKVLAYSGATALAVFTVLLVRKIPRSGGHGPSWLKEIFPEPLATAALHIGYVLHIAIVLKIMPNGLRDVLFSPTGIILLGTVFPVVESIRAAATDTSSDDRIWLQYWIMHGLFSYSTEFVDRLADRYPFIHRHWFVRIALSSKSPLFTLCLALSILLLLVVIAAHDGRSSDCVQSPHKTLPSSYF